MSVMPMVGTKTDGGAGDLAAPVAVRRLARRVGRFLAALGIVAAAALALGFAWFMARLPAAEVELKSGADGIVVLTGGASRITDAIELLNAARGRRLLISGANRAT